MSSTQAEAFVTRQPIFDRKENIFAYELLFRSGLDNFFKHQNGDQASSKVIVDTFLLFGLERMTGNRRAFINFTHDLLISGYASILPKQNLVVEILEDVELDEEVEAACKKLKEAGYMLALDDFADHEDYASLLSMADV
ncbi:MAG: EAL domain-containing protein, partial [Deltaproteobacteria bacterium]|nr:EAL domain-containing protein [Deltaproteobacteria bacterium]